MDNWDLNDSFDKLGSAYIKSYDETNNIALDISGYLIIRHDIILYNGLSLNNTLTNLETQYNNLSISGLLNSITYLNSVDQYLQSVDNYFNFYVSSLSGQIATLNNNLSTYGIVTSLMNNVTNLNNDIISLSGGIQNYYIEQGSKNSYFSTYLNSLSGYVLSLSGRIQNYYIEQGAKNIFFQYIYFL